MVNMGARVDLWHITCHSHSGNLLFKSLTNKAFNEKVTKLVKEFKSPWLEAALKAKGQNKMILSGDTRWCSIRDKFKRCSLNLDSMREIYYENLNQPPEDQYQFKEGVAEILLDQSLGIKLNRAISVYDPVCQLVNMCQKSNCSIAYAVEFWLALKFPVLNQKYERALANRLTKVINKY